MRRLLHSTAVALALMTATPPAMAYQTGLADLRVEGSARDLEGFVWYPTEDDTAAAEHHGNAVWQGIEAIADARPAAGAFPLVVLSHGMFGNAMSQSWLAADLARQGFVVAAVNHPGTSTWSRDPDDSRQLWERPKDISRTIDAVLAPDRFGAHVDPGRIYMAGHSLGGLTAIALAGGRHDARGFGAFCAAHPGELVCGILRRWRVGETQEDVARMEADLSDPRIRAFAVFDLGGAQTFAPASLGAIDRPLMIFGAPRDVDRTGLDLDLESRALAGLLTGAEVDYHEPATLSHFDFLGICRPGGLAVLREEEPEDAFVCFDGTDERRADHRLVADAVARFFSGR